MANKILYQGFCTLEKDELTEHEIVRTVDSVAVLVYVRDWDEIILVSQRRAPMVRPDTPEGDIYEVPAGRLDKPGKSICEVAAEELKEEAGVSVRPGEIQLINGGVALALSPGLLTERVYLAYVSVVSSQVDTAKDFFGADHEDEFITRRFVPTGELEDMTHEDIVTMTLICWFLRGERW